LDWGVSAILQTVIGIKPDTFNHQGEKAQGKRTSEGKHEERCTWSPSTGPEFFCATVVVGGGLKERIQEKTGGNSKTRHTVGPPNRSFATQGNSKGPTKNENVRQKKGKGNSPWESNLALSDRGGFVRQKKTAWQLRKEKKETFPEEGGGNGTGKRMGRGVLPWFGVHWERRVLHEQLPKITTTGRVQRGKNFGVTKAGTKAVKREV